MTGEKNKYTTTEKLWKLNDDMLSTPEHDNMVLWLLDYINTSRVLILEKYQFRVKKICGDDAYSRFVDRLNDTMSQFTIDSEVPITANNGFLVGYCDVVVSLKKIFTDEFYYDRYFGFEDFIRNVQVRGALIGNECMWCDLINHHISKPKYIEVKPKIKSFGETLRQLRTYKHYLNVQDIYLFTKDMRFKDAFESQGISVIDANQFMGSQ